jgi:hypothetical protein
MAKWPLKETKKYKIKEGVGGTHLRPTFTKRKGRFGGLSLRKIK